MNKTPAPLYQTLIEKVQEVVFITDNSGKWIFLNPSWERLTGFKIEESIGKTFFSYLHPDDVESNAAHFAPLIAREKDYCDHAVRYKTADDGYIWMQVFAQILDNSSGEQLGTVGTLRDISDKKKAEDDFKQMSDLQSVINGISGALAQALPGKLNAVINDSLHLLANQLKVERVYIFLREEENSLGKVHNTHEWSATGSSIAREELDEIPKQLLSQWRNELHYGNLVHISDVDILTNDRSPEREAPGKFGIKSILLMPMTYGQEVIGYMGFDSSSGAIDWHNEIIDLLKMAGEIIGGTIKRFDYESRILDAKKEAENANRAKSNFIANMSHEIRTPLNSILGFAEIIESSVTSDKLRAFSRDILNSGKSLLFIINDILELSKIEADKMELKYSTVNIRELAREMQSAFSVQANNKRLIFDLQIDSSMPDLLTIDEARLRQVLFNLIGNAIKFTNAGKVTVIFEAAINSIFPEKVNLIIKVIDTGIGIPPHHKKTIFNAFSQIEDLNTKKHKGTGLGLTITRRIVDMMGGEISVKSKVGVGSNFTVAFNDVEIAHNVDRAIDDEDASEIEFPDSTVLIVDDNDDNRQIFKEYLESCNLSILEAENGYQAISMARVCRPDLILMDIQMPDMDGIEAAQSIKANKQLLNVPIIAITAYALNENKNNILKVCNDYLPKPISRLTLISKLRQYLPYNKIAANTLNQKSEKSNFNLQLDDEMTKLIRQQVLPRFHEVKEDNIVSNIRKFGEFLREFGSGYSVREIALLGQQLIEAVEIYDFTQILEVYQKIESIA